MIRCLAVAVPILMAAAPATRPTTAPTRLRVTVWRVVNGHMADLTNVMVVVGSPGATVATVGGTTLTVDQVMPVEHGDCHLRVAYTEADVNARAGETRATTVSVTIAGPLEKRFALGSTHRGGQLSMRVSAAADPTTRP